MKRLFLEGFWAVMKIVLVVVLATGMLASLISIGTYLITNGHFILFFILIPLLIGIFGGIGNVVLDYID